MFNRRYDHSTHTQFSESTFHGGQTINIGGCGSQDEQDRLLSKLPYADGAAFNSRFWEHEAECLPDTRVDLLEHINSWSKDPRGSCIFWLNGIAGTGKSTIARTVARTWSNQKRLGASFFFSKGRGDLGHAGKLFTSFAAQLATTLPALKPYLYETMKAIPDIFQRGLCDQWKYLILQPLSNLKVSSQQQVFVLVIDALDECEGDDDIKLILRLLAEAKKEAQLRVFVTSRPETPIRFGFHRITQEAHQDFVLHNISPPVIQHDISIFLHHELEIIQRENQFPEGWPGEGTIKLLSERAQGLFIYAATACRFIRDPSWNPVESLSLILQDAYVGQSSTQELDEIYTRILTHSIILRDRRNKEQLYIEFRLIVGSIVILPDYLSSTILARLLELPVETIKVRLRCLHSVLDVPDSDQSPIRLLHPSFRDFLQDQQRCLERQFWIDENHTHGHLFMNCIKVMSKHLKRDMCKLRLPGAFTSKVKHDVLGNSLPLEVQYACQYWVHHVLRSNVKLSDNGEVHTFLRNHFLYWVEALSLIGKMSDCVLIVKSLEEKLTHDPDATDDFRLFVYDAKRFVLNNRAIVETAPLQLYCSALAFSPRTSRIRRQFWDQIPSWIKNIPEVQKDWSPMLQSLDGHSGMVRTVAFTPDGKLLASASCDGTARLWDPSTGASRGILEGHSYNVAAAFSPDVLLLATGYDDGTVKLWETSTGASRVTLEGHDSFVWAVAFSPDGQLLASASNDGTVRLWGVLTRAAHCTPSCHRSVSALAFSPDGQLLASASDDGMVKLWDPSTGVACGTLQGDSCDLIAVAFSPVRQLLACSSSNSKVTLWDPSTGASHNIRTNDDDFDCVNALAFSLDGLLLASASLDNRIKLWDPSTGAACGTLEGHSSRILAMAFSPDGQLLASASYDNTVRLWDIKTKKTIEKLDTKTPIEELSFLSNCSYLSTCQGILELKRLTNCESRSQSNSRLFPLRVSGNWVKVGEENILWLPPTYQPRTLSVRDNILAMGLGSGEVVFVEFDPATIPLGESFAPDSQQGV